MARELNPERRRFLRAGGAALAWPYSARAVPAEAPREFRLRSAELELWLDRERGIPLRYVWRANGAQLRGDDTHQPPRATLARHAPWGLAKEPLRVIHLTHNNGEAWFQCQVSDAGQLAAAMTLHYRLVGASIWLTLESITEKPGYELIGVDLPRLVTLRESDGPGWLAHGDEGGELAYLDQARPGSLPRNVFWGRVLATLPVLMLANQRLLCVMEVTAFMDGAALAVTGPAGRRRAAMGTWQAHRVNGSECVDLNLAPPPGGPRNCGTPATPNLLIEQTSACRLDFVPAGARGLTWLDGAKLVRRRMPAMPTQMYEGRLLYNLFCDSPRLAVPAATFVECETLLAQVAALTDRTPQIAALWGWQFKGKDTGYPDISIVNARLGGYAGLVRLMERAPSHNAIATLADNYDDAYRSSPEWNAAMIARRPDGHLWRSRAWTGEHSYILGLAKYMAGPGSERVRTTCARYPLHGTTHIDVLSYFALRNDWDREHPASGIKNLRDGRYQVVDLFRQHGVDVSSEALRYSFIGKITAYNYAQEHREGQPEVFGGEAIPLLPTVYRKSAIWGQSGSQAAWRSLALRTFFYNGCGRPWIRGRRDLRRLVDYFYLLFLPWSKIHALDLEAYEREGFASRLEFEGGSEVWLDWKNQRYAVRWQGNEIARDLATFCPLDERRMAFYALTARELQAPKPAQWRGTLRARRLTPAGPQPYSIPLEGETLRVFVPARQPVIVESA